MYRVRVRKGHVSAMYRDVSIETISIVYRIRVSWREVDTRPQNLQKYMKYMHDTRAIKMEEGHDTIQAKNRACLRVDTLTTSRAAQGL